MRTLLNLVENLIGISQIVRISIEYGVNNKKKKRASCMHCMHMYNVWHSNSVCVVCITADSNSNVRSIDFGFSSCSDEMREKENG